MSGCDLSRSRVSKVENTMSPSLSVSAQAPSMYCLPPASMLTAVHFAFIVGFVVGLAISLWSANSGINALFDALNIVYSEKEKRSFIKLYALTLGFTTGAIAFLLIALAAVVGIPIVLNYIGLAGSTDLLVRMLRWPILFVCITVALVCIYRLGPSRTTAQWRWITWGSVIAGMLWIAASLLFSWYAANFGSFNKTYGSIGAEIGAEMEHQTAHDTTTGRPKPMGRRGAVMADTLGGARK